MVSLLFLKGLIMATTTNNNDSAFSGGLLVVLGILVAIGLAVFFYNHMGTRSTDINIRANTPAATGTGTTGTGTGTGGAQ
jgi:hypothetical protein